MKVSIESIILKEAQAEKDQIINNAKKDKNETLTALKKELEHTYQDQLSVLEDQYQKNSDLLKGRLERKLQLEVEKIKLSQLDDIFNQVLAYLKSLAGKALLDFVVTKIKAEKVNGDEIIQVSKNEYGKYQTALSSQVGDLVDCDILNEKLKTKFTLSKEPIEIESGFVLIGKTFDLNFSFEAMVRFLQTRYEKEIYERLG